MVSPSNARTPAVHAAFKGKRSSALLAPPPPPLPTSSPPPPPPPPPQNAEAFHGCDGEGAQAVKVAVHIRPLIGAELLQGCKDCVSIVYGEPQVCSLHKKSRPLSRIKVFFLSVRIIGEKS